VQLHVRGVVGSLTIALLHFMMSMLAKNEKSVNILLKLLRKLGGFYFIWLVVRCTIIKKNFR